MKRRLLWLALGLLLGMAAGYYYLRPVRPPAAAPATQPVPAPAPPAEVAIQDSKTIDFSSGKAEVRDTPADRAALERAKREMDAAVKDVKFAPTKPAPKPD